MFRFLWEIIKHFNLRGYLYVWANLAFVAVSLPVLTIPLAGGTGAAEPSRANHSSR
jgi:hypothetical protein